MQENDPDSPLLVNDVHVAATAKLVEALVQSENRMRLRLELLSEVVIEIDTDRCITFVNKAWLAIGGSKVDTVRGRPLRDLFAEEDRPLVDALVDANGGIAGTERITCRIIRPDGGTRWVEFSIIPIGVKGWVGTMRDVTEERSALEQLRLLSLVANHTDNFVIITDARGLIRWVNKSFQDFTGYGLDEIRGRSPGSFLQGPETDPAEVQRLRDHIRAGRSISSEILNYRKNGNAYWVTLHLTPILDDKGEIDSYIAVQTNTTEMHELYIQLEHQKSQAEKANEAKSQFLSNVSHEIRTPLNAVIGLLRLLERTPLGPVQAAYLDKMGTASRHLLRLINDILDFSKIEAGMMQLDQHVFALHDVIKDVADILSTDCDRKGLSCQIDAAAVAGIYVTGDARKLTQVLLNLAGNAAKFTHAGFVRFRVTQAEAGGPVVTLRFEIEDTGIGIQADQMARIFHEFRQGEASTTRQFGGTGLGLSISQNLVQMMGGRIEVDSTPGVGSRFHFSLRLPRANLGATQSPGTDPQGARHPRLAGRRLLLVEDNAVNQMVAEEILTQEGAVVTTVGNGAIAVDRVAAAPEALDLILMDLQMPVMDGFEAARRILSRHGDLPIVAMTANIQPGDIAASLAAGMRAHVGKPFDIDVLVSTILAHARTPAAPPGHDHGPDVRTLQLLLTEGDMAALDAWGAIRATWPEPQPAWVTDLGAAIDRLDFEAALALLPAAPAGGLPDG